MKNIDSFKEIILCIAPVDFRKGMRSLSILVESQLGFCLFNGTLFLFTNRHKDAIKILYWDNTGFAIWHKILDKERFKWPKNVDNKNLCITTQELQWLLDGIDFTKIKKHNILEYSSVS